MALLVDLFGYLTIIIHGLTIVSQSMAIGGVIFLVFLARPFVGALGPVGASILSDTRRITILAAAALVLSEAATIALEAAILVGTVDLPIGTALGASSVIAGFVKIATAALIAILLVLRGSASPGWLLLALGAGELFAATLTTHSVARLDDRGVLFVATFIHQLGAAIWIGGIPAFLMALWRIHDGKGWRLVGARFSLLSQIGVGCIFVSALVFSLLYIGAPDAVYGTAYGVMAGAKAAMFVALLALGYANSRTVARLKYDVHAPVTPMKRFAEVEVAVGFALFFAAASLTSVPPSVDLETDRVSWQEVVERNTPHWPNMRSPEHDALAISVLQTKLDAEAEVNRKTPELASTPGSGELVARNAADIGWSEYNHHWAGVFLLLIGLAAMLSQAGLRMARHWPLLFLVPAAFLFIRADPDAWPLGAQGFWESFRDIETLQHRFFVGLLVIFAVFEWRVRTGASHSQGAALVFPVATALGGIALLTHSHAINNVKEALLIELTHTPLALAGVAAGASRWLELRLPGRGGRIAGWVWPVSFLFIGLLLLFYRET